MTKNTQAPARARNGSFAQRISASTRNAIMLMVWEGYTLRDAALAVGMKVDTFRRNMTKKHVKAVYNQEFNRLKSGAAVQAYTRIAARAAGANSETVAQRADEWLAGVEGISPVKKVEGSHSHSVTFGGFAFARDTVDVTPDHDTTSADIAHDDE